MKLSDGRSNLSYYGRDVTKGFFSGSSGRLRGKKAAGFDLNHRVNDDFSVRLKHHQQALTKEQGETLEDDQSSSSSTVQATYNMTDKLSLTGELRHRDVGDKKVDSLALQGRYQLSSDAEIRFTQQSSTDDDSQTRMRMRTKLSDKLSVEGRVNHDGSGYSFGVGGDYLVGKKLTLGAGLEQNSGGRMSSRLGTSYRPNEDTSYRLSLDSSALDSGKSTRGLTLGTDQRLSDNARLSAGTSLSTSGDSRRNSKDAKLSYRLADDREVYGSVSHYSHQDDDSIDDGHEVSLGGDITSSWTGYLKLGQGDLHRPESLDKRRSLALGVNYRRPAADQQQPLEGGLRYEVRQDRGAENIDATLASMHVKGHVNQDVTLMGALRWGINENADNGLIRAQSNRFDLSAAYRPVLKDRLNIIGKYSWVEDQQPQEQIGSLGLEGQRAEVLSADILYDFSSKWSLGSRLAMRYGREKIWQLPWADSRRWLVATRMGYKFAENTKLNLEYRLLKDLRARDQKEGTVIELVRRFNDKIEVGIGVNYSGFSDDLGQMDYTEKGAFLRITGVLQ